MSKPCANVIANGALRAQRFAIPMSIQFRARDDAGWQGGQVENVSRNGILFRALRPLAVHTPIEIRFELPAEMGGVAGAQVLCAGEIVRVISESSLDTPPRLAARIWDYYFLRGKDQEDEE